MEAEEKKSRIRSITERQALLALYVPPADPMYQISQYPNSDSTDPWTKRQLSSQQQKNWPEVQGQQKPEVYHSKTEARLSSLDTTAQNNRSQDPGREGIGYTQCHASTKLPE